MKEKEKEEEEDREGMVTRSHFNVVVIKPDARSQKPEVNRSQKKKVQIVIRRGK